MRKTITIGTREVDLASNAATAILYKQTFHEDLLKTVTNLSTASSDMLDAVEKIQRLAFIMSKQAEGKPFSALSKELTEDSFIEWLCGFEESDFQAPETLLGIIGVWNKNFESASEAKNA